MKMAWAAVVVVEVDGEPREIKGTSYIDFERAEHDKEVMLYTIRVMNPGAVIVDAYYITRQVDTR